jgi:hypothetical protein
VAIRARNSFKGTTVQMDSPRVLDQTDCDDKASRKPVTVDSGKPIRPKDYDAVIERSA